MTTLNASTLEFSLRYEFKLPENFENSRRKELLSLTDVADKYASLENHLAKKGYLVSRTNVLSGGLPHRILVTCIPGEEISEDKIKEDFLKAVSDVGLLDCYELRDTCPGKTDVSFLWHG